VSRILVLGLFLGILMFGSLNTAIGTEFNVLPEIVQNVPLSSTDVNRISCTNGIISDVVFSQEKGIEVKQVGKNAFIKYTIQIKGNKEKYITRNTEFHIICDGEIYTLIAKPRKGDPVIVRLGDRTKQRIKDNIRNMSSIPKEKQIIALSKNILSQEYEPSYRVTKENEKISLYEEIELTKVLTVNVDGTGLKASEYIITAKKDLNIRERDFLSDKLGVHIVGVTVFPQSILKGNQSRVVIVSEANR